MNLLVVGSGQLSQAIAEAALGTEVDVLVGGRPELDLTNAPALRTAVTNAAPAIVLNAAAYTAVDKAESEPDLAYAVNARGAGHLADVCNDLGVPLIHLSTDYVFDGRAERPYREDDPVGPISVYGRTKFEGEQLVAVACPRHVIVRTAWVHSPWGTNFVKTILRLAETRLVIGVVDDQLGSPTYAPHLASALLAVGRRIAGAGVQGPWGTYHAVDAGGTTWCGFAREVLRQASRQGLRSADVQAITAADYPTAARRPANSRLDCNRLQSIFGLALPDWKTGVVACVERLARISSAGQHHS